MKPHPGALVPYLFALAILYLAGSYFGSFLLILFYLFLIYPLASLLLSAYSARRLTYRQGFEIEQPVKGQRIQYELILSNGSFLPLYWLEVQFKWISPGLGGKVDGFVTSLGKYQSLRKRFTLNFPYRGLYAMGLARIEMRDFLHLFHLEYPVPLRSFRVYPRVLSLSSFPSALEEQNESRREVVKRGIPDYARFSHLREYRSGEPLRHVSWKKFASLGTPQVKEYDTAWGQGNLIFLDLRRPPLDDPARLEVEDASIETLVALVKFFLEREAPVTVLAPGSDLYYFSGSHRKQFSTFYESTARLVFCKSGSPLRSHWSRARMALLGSRISILITHLPDAEFLTLLESLPGKEQYPLLIVNQVQLRSRRRFSYLLDQLRHRGAKLLTVEDPEGIVPVLEQASDGFS